jgi:hypothetical protein
MTIQTRKMVNLATASTVSSRKSGVIHHKSPSTPACVFMKYSRTFFFFSSSAERSSLAFSWLLRFFKRVSGTRIWSAVGTLLFQISLLSRIQRMEKERRMGIAAKARHSRSG